jgi:ABC-type transport system involved in multi-copper enzyme maturation permease subunit
MPLFLALGLIRDESENGTLHYLLSKPIHRGEFIVYRLSGYLIFTGGFVLAMSLLMAAVTVTLGPDGNRLGDINVWFGIGVVTVLSLAAYGSIFNAMGLASPKYGVYFALVYGVYEFAMAVMTLFGADLVPIISVSHWSLQMIDAIVILAWPDTIMLAQMATAFNLESGLAFFWNPPVHTFGTGSSALAMSLSVVVLLAFITLPVLIGQSIFNRREID